MSSSVAVASSVPVPASPIYVPLIPNTVISFFKISAVKPIVFATVVSGITYPYPTLGLTSVYFVGSVWVNTTLLPITSTWFVLLVVAFVVTLIVFDGICSTFPCIPNKVTPCFSIFDFNCNAFTISASNVFTFIKSSTLRICFVELTPVTNKPSVSLDTVVPASYISSISWSGIVPTNFIPLT